MKYNNPIRFGECCEKCGRPRISCVCIRKIVVENKDNDKDRKNINDFLDVIRNQSDLIYKWNDNPPDNVRTLIENFFQLVPKKAIVRQMKYLFPDGTEKDYYTTEVELQIKNGAIGVRVKYEI